MKQWTYDDVVERFVSKKLQFKVLALPAAFFALSYIAWRYTESLNLHALWFALPVAIAESYGIADAFFFMFTVWKPRRRLSPDPAGDESVDVFITTYNEPIGILEPTVKAAMRIEWDAKAVYVLDDGNRSEVAALCAGLNCGYITRGAEWEKKPRHAKAGNVNNALLSTSGDYILILDTDQVPKPGILKRTLGYFRDPKVAFIQTPQHFGNIPRGDPFGVDAPLFYGPIMQGKDGWDAAFFCGSNGLLRREALMQAGLIRHVREAELRLKNGLITLRRQLGRISLGKPEERWALAELRASVAGALDGLRRGVPSESIRDRIAGAIRSASGKIELLNLVEGAADLRAMGQSGDRTALEAYERIAATMTELGSGSSAGDSLGISEPVLFDISRISPDEAIPVQAMVTSSITEDMASALFLHSQGWKSVFHPEILAVGIAPEDLGSMLGQRLRWAQGTLQVFRMNNPLTMKGLSLAQRFAYFNTIYSYFSGFFNLILIMAPIVYLFTGIAPIAEWSGDFFIRFIPFFVLNKLLFRYATRGIRIWRGEQYNLALFPLWIQAVFSVFTGRKLSFKVTPKVREEGNYLPLVWPQIAAILGTAAAISYRATLIVLRGEGSLAGFFINAGWGTYNIVLLSVILFAAVYTDASNQRSVL